MPDSWTLRVLPLTRLCQDIHERPTRTHKNLMQERDVPIWQRENLPLLFHGESLVWVPGVGIAAEYACKTGQNGILPSWRVAGKAPLC